MSRPLIRTAVGLGGAVALAATVLTGPASAAQLPVQWEFENYPNTYIEIAATIDNGLIAGYVELFANPNGTQTLEVCNVDGTYTEGNINPADANGNATAQIIYYKDWAGGGCYTRTLGYPIRKLYMEWYDESTGTLVDSNWVLPPAIG